MTVSGAASRPGSAIGAGTAPTALPPRQPAGLKDVYDSYFQVVSADTEELREWGYRLRYQVYCVENAFEPISANPGERETDQYDSQSAHSLLVHRPTGTVVGTTRLILPKLNGSATPLPVQRLCSRELLNGFSDSIAAGSAAELSRFAIAKEFRRRAEDRGTIAGGLSASEGCDPRRVIPHISLGLMQSALAMATEGGITHIYAIMEPALLRMLRHLGIHFVHIGPVVDYHGRRQPCFCEIETLLATTWKKRPDVWEVLTDGGRLRPYPVAHTQIVNPA